MEINYRDPYGRQFSSLRISLTQACNFSCTYCVPENFQLQAAKDEMKPEEVYKITKLLVEVAGITKLRLTGGEPLIYRRFDDYMRMLSALPLNDLSLTTNATALKKKLPVLLEAGIKRINVSLDSVNPDTFKKMCRTSQIGKTLQGIEAALEANLKLKVNMVPMREFNHADILPMLDYCLERGMECRYIELMKMGHVSKIFDKNFISMNEILNLIRKKYEIKQASAPKDSTAQRYEVVGKGFFGIIPNESVPFCKSCSRLRLCSTGFLYGCLSNTQCFSIRPLLDKDEAEAKELLTQTLIDAMTSKQIQFQGASTYMQAIGG